MSLRKFFDSPQNRTGILVWLGTTITALIQRYALHQAPSSVDIFGLILGLLKIIEPENTATVAQLQKSMMDIKLLLKAPNVESLGAVASDVVGIVEAIKA